MAFITIISDFGTKDGSAAIIKGELWKENSQIQIAEISHEVNPFDLYEAAFILGNTYSHYPNKTVHLVCVDSLVHPTQKPLCIELDNHFFIANDNGILSLLNPAIKPTKIVELDFFSKNNDIDNIVTDVYCKAAHHIINGGSLSVIGKELPALKDVLMMQPIVKENKITGNIVYVDNYGNAISNIHISLFNTVGKKRSFEILARSYNFNSLVKNYSDIVTQPEHETRYHGKSMALFNSNGYLEIAMYKSNNNSVGGASSLLGLYKSEKIIINFE